MSAVIEFGFNATPAYAGINKLDSELNKLNKTVTNVGKRGGGGGGLSNMSFQLQDIAVQLQAGTKASTIFAQQGSQMLSAFGPAGAVAGTVAAIGGAMWTAGDSARTAFIQARESISAAHTELQGIIKTGTLEEINNGMRGIVETTALLKKSAPKQLGADELWADMLAAFSGTCRQRRRSD